ncbi:hypothetical protein HY636_05370 [Candidatus Woesearchaeota archaeon]|nr:hypothetical protein [Candidatus Woesearchaeota archaeon]
MSKIKKEELWKIVLVITVSCFVLITLILGIILETQFNLNKLTSANSQSNKLEEENAVTAMVGYTTTTVSVQILNAKPTIASFKSYSTYTNYHNLTQNVVSTLFSICSDTNTGINIYFTLNYTDNNIYKDVSERGNIWFRIQTVYTNGSIDPQFDSGYFLGKFIDGENVNGGYNGSYIIYNSNFTNTNQNFSVTAKIFDGDDTVYSTSLENLNIQIQKTDCAAQQGGKKKQAAASTLPVSLQPEEKPFGKIPEKKPTTSIQIPPVIETPMPTEMIEKEGLEQIEFIPSQLLEMLKYDYTVKAIVAINEELDEQISKMEEEMADKETIELISKEERQELSVSLMNLLGDIKDLSRIEKEEKIDDAIEQVIESAKTNNGFKTELKESRIIGNFIKSAINLPKYEETHKKDVNLNVNEQIKFVVDDVRHKLEIEASNDHDAEIIVKSEPIKLLMKVGEKKEIDINNDFINDIAITLLGINGGKKKEVKVSIASLNGKMIIESKKTSYMFVSYISKISDAEWIGIFTVILLVFAVLLHYCLVFKNKKIKRTKVKIKR